MFANLLIGGIVSGIVGFVGYKAHNYTKAVTGVMIEESVHHLVSKVNIPTVVKGCTEKATNS